MQKNCTQCSAEFDITQNDLAYYEKVSPVFQGKKELVPPPTKCPECREQQRMCFRNEWSFYHRACDLTGKKMLSIYSADKPYTVYEQSVWWSDQYDPLAYGRDFDFSRPFFDQWQDLSLVVPRASIHNAKSENSEYTNYSSENKNCYLAIGSSFNEDTLYSYRASHCKNICDCYDPYECELCHEVSFSKKLYNCRECMQCHGSSGLTLCSFCTGCTDCFGCTNLRNKKYHIFNEPYDKETYERKRHELLSAMPDAVEQAKAFRLTQPHRAVDHVACEHCSGDHLINCKNCHDVYILKDSEDCRYCSFCEANTSCMDANFSNIGELQFHSTNLVKNYHVMYANLSWYNNECIYITSCFNSSHLFGCIGMKKNEYCILNKQYTKEEYDVLVPRIIEHMRKTPLRLPDGSFAGQEWGEYYPAHYSPFCFNESTASIEHPLDKISALARGWKWYEEEELKDRYLGPAYSIPPRIADVPDDITKKILICSATGRPYKIIPQELALYRRMDIPIPTQCPDQRHRNRIALGNAKKLYFRQCAKCQKDIQTTYLSLIHI